MQMQTIQEAPRVVVVDPRAAAAVQARAVGAFAIAAKIEDGSLGPEAVPNGVVVEAILNAFKTGQTLLAELRYHPLDGMWSFCIHGIFVGVEADGYIHS